MATDEESVPNEVKARYISIIDNILAGSDLTQVTEKRIRQGIADRVEYDITPQKVSTTVKNGGRIRLTVVGSDQGFDHGAL